MVVNITECTKSHSDFHFPSSSGGSFCPCVGVALGQTTNHRILLPIKYNTRTNSSHSIPEMCINLQLRPHKLSSWTISRLFLVRFCQSSQKSIIVSKKKLNSKKPAQGDSQIRIRSNNGQDGFITESLVKTQIDWRIPLKYHQTSLLYMLSKCIYCHKIFIQNPHFLMRDRFPQFYVM